ncbi:MAG: hypothetical protein ACX930_00500 [Erythrobacter sp.]
MSAYSYRGSGPDRWSNPRQSCDPTLRRYHYGKVQPMEEPRGGFFAKLLRAS